VRLVASEGIGTDAVEMGPRSLQMKSCSYVHLYRTVGLAINDKRRGHFGGIFGTIIMGHFWDDQCEGEGTFDSIVMEAHLTKKDSD